MSSQAGDISSSADGDSTFTTLCTPNLQNQLEQLAREPPIAATQSETPSKRKGMFAKMRKPKGNVDSESLSFKKPVQNGLVDWAISRALVEWTFKNSRDIV